MSLFDETTILHTVTNYTTFNEMPTISFIVYQTTEQENILRQWIDTVDIPTTIYRLIDINISYDSLVKKMSIEKYLF